MKKIAFLLAVICMTVSGSSAQSLVSYLHFGGNDDDGIYDMVTDHLGNVYITGWYTGEIDLDPGVDATLTTAFGDRDIFVSKFDSAGNFLWGFGMGAGAQDEGQHLTIDSGNNVIVSGRFSSVIDFDPGPSINSLISAGNRDIFLVKYDSAGNYVWGFSMGGTGYDDSEDVATDSNNNIYLAGSFRNNATFNGLSGAQNVTSLGGDDAYVAKFAADGTLLWVKTLGSTGIDDFSSILVDNAGHFYCAGYISGIADFDFDAGTFNLNSNGSADAFIAKYTSEGVFNWVRCVGGAGFDLVWDFDLLGDDLFMTGAFYDTVDFNPGGSFGTRSSVGQSDVFLWIVDTMGLFKTVLSSGGGGFDSGKSVVKENNTRIIVSGVFQDSIELNGLTNSQNLISKGGNDIFISCFTVMGELNWAFGIGGSDDEDSRSVIIGIDNSLLVPGIFNTSVDLSSNSSVPVLIFGNTILDVFIAKYNIATTTGFNELSSVAFNLYPNPVADFITVNSESRLDNLCVYSSDGKVIAQYDINENTFSFSIFSLSPGCYTVRIKSGDKYDFKKIVKI